METKFKQGTSETSRQILDLSLYTDHYYAFYLWEWSGFFEDPITSN